MQIFAAEDSDPIRASNLDIGISTMDSQPPVSDLADSGLADPAILLDEYTTDPVPDTQNANTYSGDVANNSTASLVGSEETNQLASLLTESIETMKLSSHSFHEASQSANEKLITTSTNSLSDLSHSSPVADETGKQGANFRDNKLFETTSHSLDTMSETAQSSLNHLASGTEDFPESGQESVTLTFDGSTKTLEGVWLSNLTRIDESLEITQFYEKVTLTSHDIVSTASIVSSADSASEHVNRNSSEPIDHTTAYVSENVSQPICQNETSSQVVIQTNEQVTQTGVHNKDASLNELETLSSQNITETADVPDFSQTTQTNTMRPLEGSEENTEQMEHETSHVTFANEEATTESALVTTGTTTYTTTRRLSSSSQTQTTDSPDKLITTSEYSERFTSDSFHVLSTSQSQMELSQTSNEGLTVWLSAAPSPAGQQMRIVIIGGAGLGALFVVLMLVVVVFVCRKRLRK